MLAYNVILMKRRAGHETDKETKKIIDRRYFNARENALLLIEEGLGYYEAKSPNGKPTFFFLYEGKDEGAPFGYFLSLKGMKSGMEPIYHNTGLASKLQSMIDNGTMQRKGIESALDRIGNRAMDSSQHLDDSVKYVM
jgi:hypothetical protein